MSAVDLDLTEEQRLIVGTVRDFVERELYPHEDEVERLDEVPPDLAAQIRAKALAAGLYAANMPANLGGGGLDAVGVVLAERELGRASYALQMLVEQRFHIGLFTLKLAFNASKPGFYTDFITMPNEPILPLSVQGLLEPKDAVETQPVGTIYFYLYPNPSPGLLTIHTENITTAHVIITDVLGRTEQQTDFAGDWIWDGASVSDGTYFANITATTASGFQVHEIRRIVILH